MSFVYLIKSNPHLGDGPPVVASLDEQKARKLFRQMVVDRKALLDGRDIYPPKFWTEEHQDHHCTTVKICQDIGDTKGIPTMATFTFFRIPLIDSPLEQLASQAE